MDDDEYTQDETKHAEEAEELIAEIIDRCEKAGIEYDDNSDHELIGVTEVFLDIFLPSGRKKREVSLWDLDDLREFAAIEFEKFTVLGNFAAICRYDNGLIEAAFVPVDDIPSPPLRSHLLRRLGLISDLFEGPQDLTLESEVAGHKISIVLGRMSSELRVLVNPPRSMPISLRIHHPKFATHAEALKILERLSHSLFFEIESESDVGLTLLRRRSRRGRILPSRKQVQLEFPRYEYDDGPMSLYWYARSARNMPLLQFLAFYQAIEFYFPAYFNAEVSRRVRTIIKDPSFRVDREADMARLVSVAMSRGNNFGSEREQLRATLRECVDDELIKKFLSESKERAEFFGSKQKGITSCTLNPKNKGSSLVDQVSERIYEIRCKVVHVKSDDGDPELELLLPYTEEAEKLGNDIELVRMLAKSVLVASSSPLRLTAN